MEKTWTVKKRYTDKSTDALVQLETKGRGEWYARVTSDTGRVNFSDHFETRKDAEKQIRVWLLKGC